MKWWRQFFASLRLRFRKEQVEEEMDEEMHSHIEMQMQQNMGDGMSHSEARRAALRQFGWMETVKETCREQCQIMWVQHFRRDLSYATKMLFKSPGFTLVAILTLALGIGLNVVLFTQLDDEFLRPRQALHPEQLWQLVPADASGKPRFFNFSKPYYDAIRHNNHIFQSMTRIFRVNAQRHTGGLLDSVFGNVVGANYFEFIGIYPMLGRTFMPEEDLPGANPVAVISYGFWQQQFGGQTNVLGQMLELDGYKFEIIGVMPPGFVGLGSPRFQFIIPWGTVGLFYPSPPHDAIVRLQDGVSPSAAADSFAPAVQEVTRMLHPPGFARLKVPPEAGNNSEFTRVALLRAGYGSADRHFAYEDRGNLIQVNSLAGFGTLLVLLIAAGNLANLLLARGLHRRRELATRIALGATRGQLVRQLALEGALLATLGAFAVLATLNWFGKAAPKLISTTVFNSTIPVNFHPDFRVVAFALGLTLLTSIGFSLPPAFAATNFAPFQALRDGGSGGWGHRWSARTLLVVAQVSASLVLLSSVVLCLRAIDKQVHTAIGFEPEPLVMASVDLEQVGFTTNNARATCQELLNKLSALPGMSTVGMVDRAPYGGERGSLATDRVRLHEGVEVEHATVDVGPNYFKALGVPLIAGHEVSEADFASGRDVALVNETFVRTFWPDQTVLGWPIEKIRRRKFEIIGIVQDARLDSPAKAPRPTVFYSADIYDALHPTFVLHANHAEALIPLIRSELSTIHPFLGRSSIHTVRDAMRWPFNTERNIMNLLAEIALVALALTMLGAYGLVSFLVKRRTNEFGIRLAVGAGRSDILKLILKLGLSLALVGTALGLPVALGGSFLLRHLVPGVSPLDYTSFTIAAGGVLLAILLACYLPARRASRVNPMTALRHE
jgi:predicted permease